DSVYRGTLCGKFPALPVWLTILPLADWRGHIDLTPEAISALTGWPLELLLQGIAELEKPDARSRSLAEEGRRIVRLDPSRDWGWRVVNIKLYRKRCSDIDAVESGDAAERARRYRERKKEGESHVPSRGVTADHGTHTHTHTQTKSQERARAARPAPRKRCPEDFRVTEELRAWASQQAPDVDLDRATASFRDWEFKTAKVD